MLKNISKFANKNIKQLTTIIGLLALITLVSFFAIKFDDKEYIKIAKLSSLKIQELIMIVIGSLGGVISTYVIHLITKNKVADTGTIGISSLNMTIFTLVYVFANANVYFIRDTYMPMIYFVGSLLMLTLIYFLTFKYKKSANKILLAGIILSLTLGAVNYAIQASLNYSHQLIIKSYRAGSLIGGFHSLTRISSYISYSFLGLSILLLIIFRNQIKIYYVDPVKAKSLGVKVNFIRILLLTIAAMTSAVLFAVFGELGFIGFMATNIVYLFVKKVGPFQFILSLLVGVVLMITIYIIKHNVLPVDIPMGIISSIISVPYLIIILLKGGKND